MSDLEVKAPKDRWSLVLVAFYYLGVTVLLPQYMLITLTEFWMYKFRDTDLDVPSNSTQLSELQKNIPGYLSITGNVPVALAVLLCAIWGSRVSVKRRMLISGFVELVTFSVLTLLTGIELGSNQLLLVLVLTASSLFSLGSGVFQATYFGNNARFPSRYIGSACDGTGLGTVIPSVISVGIIGMNTALEATGLICTGVATFFLLILLPIFYWVSTTEIYQHYSSDSVQQVSADKTSTVGLKGFIKVMKSTGLFIFIIFYNFSLTLSVHPAVTALVQPQTPDETSDWKNKYFLVVCCFLLQSTCDWLGRSLATLIRWPRPGLKGEIVLFCVVLARTGFIPLIMLCNVAPQNRSLPVIFPYDWQYVILMVFFNLLGGYIANSCMMLAPRKVEPEYQEAVGTYAIAAIVCGLGSGSVVGPALVSVL